MNPQTLGSVAGILNITPPRRQTMNTLCLLNDCPANYWNTTSQVAEIRRFITANNKFFHFDIMFMSMGWAYVSELHPPKGLLFIPQIIYEYGEPRWNNIVWRKPKKSDRKLFTTNSTWTDLGLGDERRVAKRLSHGTAVIWHNPEPVPSTSSFPQKIFVLFFFPFFDFCILRSGSTKIVSSHRTTRLAYCFTTLYISRTRVHITITPFTS
jgi:hypothetical protein